MRVTNFIIPILLFGQCSCEQEKKIYIPKDSDNDTSFWFKTQQETFVRAKIPNLIYSKEKLHFRFSTETQAIEVWTNDLKTFYGSLSNFATSYIEDEFKKEDTKSELFYSNKSPIDSTTAKEIYNIFRQLSIFKISTDDKIKGWNIGDDGNEILIEYSTSKEYSFKEYWTPSYYKNEIKEAAIIDALKNQLERILGMNKSFHDFVNTLPRGTYRAGGMFLIITLENNK